MTFLVGDNQANRHAKIRGFLNDGEPVIAVLLAAADFEWTVGRAILALGTSPNTDIRSGVLARCSGLVKYNEAWKSEVGRRFGGDLSSVVPDWEAFKKAFELRHRLIHGVAGTTGQGYAQSRVDIVLQGSLHVANFAKAKSVDLFCRLPIRQRKGSK